MVLVQNKEWKHMGREYDYKEWVEFFVEPGEPSRETLAAARKFEKRVEELLEENKIEEDVEKVAYLAYASLAGHGIGLWEGREKWHKAFEKVVKKDRELNKLFQDVDSGINMDQEAGEEEREGGLIMAAREKRDEGLLITAAQKKKTIRKSKVRLGDQGTAQLHIYDEYGAHDEGYGYRRHMEITKRGQLLVDAIEEHVRKNQEDDSGTFDVYVETGRGLAPKAEHQDEAALMRMLPDIAASVIIDLESN